MNPFYQKQIKDIQADVKKILDILENGNKKTTAKKPKATKKSGRDGGDV